MKFPKDSVSSEKRREPRRTLGTSVLKSQIMEEKLENMTEKDKIFKKMNDITEAKKTEDFKKDIINNIKCH